jgi:hypothetical protein
MSCQSEGCWDLLALVLPPFVGVTPVRPRDVDIDRLRAGLLLRARLFQLRLLSLDVDIDRLRVGLLLRALLFQLCLLSLDVDIDRLRVELLLRALLFQLGLMSLPPPPPPPSKGLLLRVARRGPVAAFMAETSSSCLLNSRL